MSSSADGDDSVDNDADEDPSHLVEKNLDSLRSGSAVHIPVESGRQAIVVHRNLVIEKCRDNLSPVVVSQEIKRCLLEKGISFEDACAAGRRGRLCSLRMITIFVIGVRD